MKIQNEHFRGTGIKVKLLKLIGIFLAILFVFNNIVNGVTIRRGLRSSRDQKLSQISEKSMGFLERILQDKILMLEGVARKETLEQYTYDSDEMRQLLKEESQSLGFTQIYMANVKGELKVDGQYENIGQETIFVRALEGKTTYSEPVSVNDINTIYLATPVYSQNNSIIGVLIAAQEVEMFRDIITNDSYTSFIMDEQGQYITHSESELTDFNSTKAEPSQENRSMIEKMLQSESGNGIWFLETTGEKYYIDYVQIPTTGWYIGILEEADVITKKITSGVLQNMIITLVLVLILMAILSYSITKRITNYIEGIADHLGILAKGDFKTPVDKELLAQTGEIGMAAKAMDDMRKQVGRMLTQLKDSINDMRKDGQELGKIAKNTYFISGEISNATQEIAVSVQNEAMDLADVLESISAFGTKIEEIVHAISVINTDITNTNVATEKGNDNAIQLSRSVEDVNRSFNEFVETIQGLNQNIKRVTDITTLIDGIASQTNLLALNASIEAARAGEAGKGFAVVADEIRKLADECKKSADSISSIIKEVSAEAESIVGSSKYLEVEMQTQKDIINQTIDVYGNITTDIENVTAQIKEITYFVKEIDEDKRNIVDKVENSAALGEEISATTEEVAASTKEMLSSAQQIEQASKGLSVITEEIVKEVSNFKV